MTTYTSTQIFTSFKRDDINSTISPPSCRWKAFSRGILDDLNWTSLVVAGEAVVNCMTVLPKYWAHTTDIDLFFHRQDGKIYAPDAVASIVRSIEKNTKRSVVVEHLPEQHKVTFTVHNYRRVNLSLVEFKDVEDVVKGFDINASKVAWRPNAWILYMTNEARQELTTRVITYNPNPQSSTYGKQLLKYAQKGFSVDMGSNYHADKVDWSKYETVDPLSLSGIHQLMAAEHMAKSVVGLSNLMLVQLGDITSENTGSDKDTQNTSKDYTQMAFRLVEPKTKLTEPVKEEWAISSIFVTETDDDALEEETVDNDSHLEEVVMEKSPIKTINLTGSPFIAYQQANFTKRVFNLWITLPGVNPSNISATIMYNPRSLSGLVQLVYVNDTLSMVNEFFEMNADHRYVWKIPLSDPDVLENQRLDVKNMRKTYDAACAVMRIEMPFYDAEDTLEIIQVV